jgi:hypothetical protein
MNVNELSFESLGACIAITSDDAYGDLRVSEAVLNSETNILMVFVDIPHPGNHVNKVQRAGGVGRYKLLRLNGVVLPDDTKVELQVNKQFGWNCQVL